MNYRLRPAGASDTAFLFTLLHATAGEMIEETWGSNEAWQRRNFDARVEQYDISIIDVDGQPAGSLWLDKRRDMIYIADLQVVPELQNQGIGAATLRELIDRAAARGIPIGLVVRQANEDARRLYERLGFTVTAVEDSFIHMRIDHVSA